MCWTRKELILEASSDVYYRMAEACGKLLIQDDTIEVDCKLFPCRRPVDESKPRVNGDKCIAVHAPSSLVNQMHIRRIYFLHSVVKKSSDTGSAPAQKCLSYHLKEEK